MSTKYSLAMIVRNCASDLDRCLSSFSEYPDEIVIVNTAENEQEEGFEETNKVALKHGAKVFYKPFEQDFSAVRNFSFSKCSNDWVMWLDSDDVVMNPAAVNNGFRSVMDVSDAHVVFMEYLYEWDGEPGNSNCTTKLKRERFVRKSCFEWRAPIHECLCAKFQVVSSEMPPDIGSIIHSQVRHDSGPYIAKLKRNLKVLETNFPDGNSDERMQFYWGNTLMGLKRFEEAISKYQNYIPRSGNQAEIVIAWNASSECARILGDYPLALKYAQNGIMIDPGLPTAWLQAAEAYMVSEMPQQAHFFASEALTRAGNRDREMVCNPRAIEGRPHVIKAVTCAQMRRWPECKREADLALQLYPDDENTLDVIGKVRTVEGRERLTASFFNIVNSFDNRADVEKFAEAAPAKLKELPAVMRVLPRHRPDGKKVIAFYCPYQNEIWGPDSIKVGGIGGSEEAVINLTREFAADGWHVEVYGNPPKQMERDGVHWYPVDAWNPHPSNRVDVMIWWRCPNAQQSVKCNAGQEYIWQHDTTNASFWKMEQWDDVDGIFVLSQYHASMHGFIPEGKLIKSMNAMDPDLMVPVKELENNPHRLIWPSDPLRGLDNLLAAWPMILEKVPDAELDIFYGWSALCNVRIKEGNNVISDVRAKVESLLDQKGVTWHGRVDQKTINEAHAKAGLWVYPTKFPEISCITAMKAQAHGNVPICTHDFALVETVQHGVKFDPALIDVETEDGQKVIADLVVEWMLDPARQDEVRKEMIPWARKLTWDRVYNQWNSIFSEVAVGVTEAEAQPELSTV